MSIFYFFQYANYLYILRINPQNIMIICEYNKRAYLFFLFHFEKIEFPA